MSATKRSSGTQHNISGGNGLIDLTWKPYDMPTLGKKRKRPFQEDSDIGAKSADRRTNSLGFTDERVPERQHICYLFNDSVERRRVMAKYVESGLPAHEERTHGP